MGCGAQKQEAKERSKALRSSGPRNMVQAQTKKLAHSRWWPYRHRDEAEEHRDDLHQCHKKLHSGTGSQDPLTASLHLCLLNPKVPSDGSSHRQRVCSILSSLATKRQLNGEIIRK